MRAPAQDPNIAIVMNAYMDRINPTPSASCLEDLKYYAQNMGAECCLRAFDIALDERKTSWSYIRAILASKLQQGVKCLADWDMAEDKRRGSKEKKPAEDPEPLNGEAELEELRRFRDSLKKEAP